MSDITEKSDRQKGAEAAVDGFRKDLGPFVVAAETIRMPMLFTDAAKPDNLIIFANDSLLNVTGYSREEVLGKDFSFLMANGSDAQALTRAKVEFESSSGAGAYATGNTGHNLGDGYAGRPVLKKPFKFEDLVAILARLKLAPIER